MGLYVLLYQFYHRYDDEKSRYRASKKASLLRMLEDEYMDPNVAANENKVGVLTYKGSGGFLFIDSFCMFCTCIDLTP